MRDTVREVVDNPVMHGGDVTDMTEDLSRYAASVGAVYFSYLLMRDDDGAETPNDEVLLTDYPEEWRKRYLRKLYRLYDPVALTTRKSRLPFFWGDGGFLRPFNKTQKRVFHEARAFQIGAGYSIPVAGPKGDLGVFSIAATRGSELDAAVRAAGAFLPPWALSKVTR